MSNYSKRKGIIVSIIISLIIWISLNFILIQFNENQKKDLNSVLTLKLSQTNQNENNVEKDVAKEKIEMIKQQYNSNKWRIIISKINLDAPIIEGTTKEILRRGVGHFLTTSKWDGNVALAAHNRGYKYNYFQELKRLEIGDIIEYQTEQGRRTYTVTWKGNIKETDLSYLENTKENILTLITCFENLPEYRLCVQAKQIK